MTSHSRLTSSPSDLPFLRRSLHSSSCSIALIFSCCSLSARDRYILSSPTAAQVFLVTSCILDCISISCWFMTQFSSLAWPASTLRAAISSDKSSRSHSLFKICSFLLCSFFSITFSFASNSSFSGVFPISSLVLSLFCGFSIRLHTSFVTNFSSASSFAREFILLSKFAPMVSLFSKRSTVLWASDIFNSSNLISRSLSSIFISPCFNVCSRILAFSYKYCTSRLLLSSLDSINTLALLHFSYFVDRRCMPRSNFLMRHFSLPISISLRSLTEQSSPNFSLQASSFWCKTLL
mmetsp:Transcript_5908/g.12352  ORF Transcript_5908/g.12352 Transcript_5908/m.12352 type:complete len:293 (+) Transcript_5908:545-1423(+)